MSPFGTACTIAFMTQSLNLCLQSFVGGQIRSGGLRDLRSKKNSECNAAIVIVTLWAKWASQSGDASCDDPDPLCKTLQMNLMTFLRTCVSSCVRSGAVLVRNLMRLSILQRVDKSTFIRYGFGRYAGTQSKRRSSIVYFFESHL